MKARLLLGMLVGALLVGSLAQRATAQVNPMPTPSLSPSPGATVSPMPMGTMSPSPTMKP